MSFGVSILILMDVCLKVDLLSSHTSNHHVSILILMDVCLKVTPGFGPGNNHPCFNPYFNGCLS